MTNVNAVRANLYPMYYLPRGEAFDQEVESYIERFKEDQDEDVEFGRWAIEPHRCDDECTEDMEQGKRCEGGSNLDLVIYSRTAYE